MICYLNCNKYKTQCSTSIVQQNLRVRGENSKYDLPYWNINLLIKIVSSSKVIINTLKGTKDAGGLKGILFLNNSDQ